MKVFLLHHTYGHSENESYKLLGVFSSEELAQEAIKGALALPGFRDHPNGFSVDSYNLNETCWPEGFGIDE